MSITVEPADVHDAAALVELIAEQEARWHTLDAALRPARPREEIAALLALHRQQSAAPLVARDAGGRARGYVTTLLREFSSEREDDAPALEVFETRTAFAESLTLPPPDASDAFPVATALLEALQARWRAQGVLAEVCRWPSRDQWVTDLLRAAGFEVFLQRSLRSAAPLAPSSRPVPADLFVRRARPADEDVLTDLYLEESDYHHQTSPYFRMTPYLAAAFRSTLAPEWQGQPLEEGGPLTVLVERAGEVVAMASTYLVRVDDFNNRDYLAPGRYADIAEVGVRADLRGQGIGRVLVQGVFDAYANRAIDGYVLGFSPQNPLSSRFWPHLGFLPNWNFYQRRPAANAS